MVDGAEWLTTEDACQLLQISRRTLVRWLGEHPVERQTVFGERGKSYLYSRAALLQVLRQVRGEGSTAVAQNGAACSAAEEDEDAQLRHNEPRSLALPPSGHVEEFLTLLADLRDQLAKTNASEAKISQLDARMEVLGHQVEQLAQVLAARLPGPSAPPSPPRRFRPRVVVEAVLLGWVGLLAGLLGVVVLTRLADVGAVALPTWWPWR